jgi:hypothetical protein
MTETDHLGISDAPVTASEPTRSRSSATSGRRVRLRLADLLLPCGIALWAFGVSTTNATALGPYGLPPVLPTAFWTGLALIVVSAAIELGRDHPSGWRMGLHAVTLAVMLYGTAPLVYSQGRYEWLYKTIGVVQYINANGRLNSQIDIYQNWPGFFALAAWFGKVAGVASPLAYAKWAQLAFELAALPLLYLAFAALSLTTRQRWLAVLLYTGTNWIGQDYFSPQALGTVLSLGIMAIALRWFYVGNSPARGRPARVRHVKRADRAVPGQTASRAGFPVLLCFALLLIYFVLSFEHELSPYILIVQLGALAIVGLLRPRWLPLLLAAIAVGYLLPHFGFVNSRYGLLNSVGQFFSNASPPALKSGSLSAPQRLIGHSQEALSLGMWCLAIAGAWLRRKSGRPVLALLLLAFSPFLMLVILAYGQEGVLRVYLFSLPWTAALAALALAPFPAAEGELKAEGTRTAEDTRKPAQALATALWVPRSESQDADHTVIFHQVAADELGQVATLATSGADAPAGEAGLRQAGASGAPPWDDSRIPAGQWSDGNPATVAGQRAQRDRETSPRGLQLTRRGWQAVIWLVLAAVVLIAGIIAAGLLGG